MNLRITLILLATCLLTLSVTASEVGYDSTLGEMHTQITYSYNINWDESYAALPGQQSQLVLAGPEVLSQVDPEPFTADEWEYLTAVLEAAGAKAILIEDPYEENVKIYVPVPSHSEPSISIPSQWQYRAGIWVRGGALQSNCEWRWFASGQRGESAGCHCNEVYRRCCGAGCFGESFCHACAWSDREYLEGLYGPDPRWQNPRAFAELEPGQRVEVEASVPY